ncbi:MAG: hypothetical protein ACMXYL_02890 [Candidatus Woesearchaeota archaeon]
MRIKQLIISGTGILLTGLILILIAPIIIAAVIILIGLVIIVLGIMAGISIAQFPSYDERERKAITTSIAFSWMLGIIILALSPIYLPYIQEQSQQSIMPIVAGIMIFTAVIAQEILKRRPGLG